MAVLRKSDAWQHADSGQVHERIFTYVQEVERVQSDIFERFIRLAALYDPNDYFVGGSGRDVRRPQVSRNVIASNVDTVAAVVASTDVRARFVTDDGDWSDQRRARHLEWYADGLSKLLDVQSKGHRGFKDAALKGIGLAKVFVDWSCNEIRVERALVDDVIVDEAECRAGEPRQMHHRLFVDKDALIARFPDFEDEIDRAGKTGAPRGAWADRRPIADNEVVVIESWDLIAKRHTICVEGCDLEDEKYKKPHFPFARIAWSERTAGWYAISLAERIADHQRRLNKLNWQIDRQLDQHAVPTTYVRMADAHLSVKTTNPAGTIVPIKGDYPQTVIPPAVSAETYRREEVINEAAYEESGLSRLAATARKPAGIESGVALREYRDQTTQRFAPQERAYEKFILDIIWLALDCCKDLGADAPTIMHRGARSYRKLDWSKVDMGDLRVQIQAASGVSRTPAGRAQQVLEWAQAGIISTDSAREALVDLDTDSEISLYRAAQESIDRDLEDIIDGEVVTPEPYDNLQLLVWRATQRYHKERSNRAPEEVLEGIRQYIVQASGIRQMAETAAQPAVPAAGGAAPEAMTGIPGEPPMPLDAALPMQPPAPAIAPQAIGVAPA